jgi:hypothetical protein
MSHPNSPPPPGRHHFGPPPPYQQSTGQRPGHPEAGYPDAGYPEAGYPQAGYPGAGRPDPGYPDAGADRGWTERPGTDHGQRPPAQRQERSWWDGVDPRQEQERGWDTGAPWTQQAPSTPPPAPPQPAYTNEPPTQDELLWADVRLQVASALKSINSKHCHEAFDRLGKRNALGPHGIVLFYAADDRHQPRGYRLLFVTRLFLAGPESDDLAQVISDLNRSATGNIVRAGGSGRRWDPRGPEDSMVNGGDMTMPRDAGFIGVGVTTLNTEQGAFATIAGSIAAQPFDTPRPKSVFDIPGMGLALLTDGTALRAVRDPDRRLGDDGITCNKTLDPTRARYWNPHSDLTTQGDQNLRAAWSQLALLQKTLQDYLLGGRS